MTGKQSRVVKAAYARLLHDMMAMLEEHRSWSHDEYADMADLQYAFVVASEQPHRRYDEMMLALGERP